MPYHINPKGEASLCRAKQKCPFGGPESHYSSLEEARDAIEKKLASLIHAPLQKEKDTDWFATPWEARKEVIQNFTGEVMEKLQEGWINEEIAAYWDMKEDRLGMAGRVGGPNGQAILMLSEVLEVCDEERAKNVVIHEISHLVDMENAHNEKWREVCETIAADFPELKDTTFDADHTFTDEEADRWEAKREADPTLVFVGVCPQGHRTFHQEAPKEVVQCARCGDNEELPLSQTLLRWNSREPERELPPEMIAHAKKLGVESLVLPQEKAS